MQEVLDRARLLLARGEPAEARKLVDGILKEHPDEARALVLLSRALLAVREGDRAVEAARRGTELSPGSVEAWHQLAEALHCLGRDEEALEPAETARRLVALPENFSHRAPAYLTLVWCLRELRRYREALEVAEEGLTLVPDAVLAQCASDIEEELAHAQRERC